ncbi:hypothetical protein F5Y10DRAFT_292071 [Nemania abortiva]|nr:hypothetical protein F5Y10DRAFT_292071 [Nemania abortiva]
MAEMTKMGEVAKVIEVDVAVEVPEMHKPTKKVHFKSDSELLEIHIIECREPRGEHDRLERKHDVPKEIDEADILDGVPPLFRCKSKKEVRAVLLAGDGNITDIYGGYNALQWYCNAKSTSPSIIREFLHWEIDIDALDQQDHTQGPIIRHTALGFACRNANVKAVEVLLQYGANPRGPRSAGGRDAFPSHDHHGNPIYYPSPLQSLLCQPIHRPRPGRCPWSFHLSNVDDDKDDYLDDDDPEKLPQFRSLAKYYDCSVCTADRSIWAPLPEKTVEGQLTAHGRRRRGYLSQIPLLGKRMRKCLQLLIDCDSFYRPNTFPQSDDPNLLSTVNRFLKTFWQIYLPLVVAPEPLPKPYVRQIFEPFGEICDLLAESAGYKEAKGAVPGKRGRDRLIELILDHPEVSSFKAILPPHAQKEVDKLLFSNAPSTDNRTAHVAVSPNEGRKRRSKLYNRARVFVDTFDGDPYVNLRVK